MDHLGGKHIIIIIIIIIILPLLSNRSLKSSWWLGPIISARMVNPLLVLWSLGMRSFKSQGGGHGESALVTKTLDCSEPGFQE